jgi:methylmalonyl-CoA mutase N-terminal domain/subunit
VLGGTQSLHTNAFDEALALPTERSAEIALRTQQILAHESGIADSPDPLAGSYVVEKLTDELQSKAEALIKRVDELGGSVGAIEARFMQGEIARSALAWQRSVEKGDSVVVGVNKFQSDSDAPQQLQNINELAVARQLQRLEAFKASRDKPAVAAALGALETAARGDENLMPHILHALRKQATLGEVCDTLRRVFGEYRDG